MPQSPTKTKKKKSLSAKLMTCSALLYFALLACVIAYVWFFAQNRYTSVASFKISRQDPASGELGFAQLALPGLSDSGSVDSQIAIGFVDSIDLLFDLEKRYQLRQHYASPVRDFVFRLKPDAPLEERLEYYRNHIFAHFDKETGMTMLTVDSFDPKLSKTIADDVLRRTEDFINHLNQHVADQQLNFVRNEVDRGDKQVKEISLEILKLQNSHNLVSPNEVIESNLKVLQQLRMDRIQTETTLASLERDSPGSPRIESLRSQLRSLDEQIAVETTKISGPEQDRLNQILARYKELELQLEFAHKMRTGAITLLEKNRMDAAARSRFVSLIQHPYLPEAVAEPRRVYASLTILGLGLLLFQILRVLVHSVLERI